MKHEIGVITALNRYPVKSMAGEALETAELGWQGIRGDRRLAFRKVGDTSGFPWLTASKLPELLLFHPLRKTENISPAPAMMNLPTHIRTPDGYELEPYSDALREDVSRRCKIDVELTHLKHGIFDESPISLISTATMNAITMNAIGSALDARRFRPNIVIETTSNRPFAEDEYVGKSLVFGDAESNVEDSARLHVALLDERCMMVNLDPDTAESHPAMMKTVVNLNNNNAGVYCNVLRTGTLALGQKVYVLT